MSAAVVAHSEPSLSHMLAEMARTAGPRVTIGAIAEVLSRRSFAALILMFALPNLFPMPPGAAAVFGFPLMYLAGQMILGFRRPYLPAILANRGFDRKTFAGLVTRMTPWLNRLERLVRPRLWLNYRGIERLIGVYVLLMAFVLVLPIPFGNWPPAISITLVGFGLLERDGLVLLLGIAVGVISVIAYGALLVGLAHVVVQAV
ncbi:exopolysaccharide biosynthesis protein [Acuticoccus sp. M5D2P5]|uniref:exopolysaccharide biosynthesis protein n=1 Tax=Acuticoccus kalidii TaxID=2910977 RepID=UPI001F2564C7|nr:exopolysaccharide biosynthesis protein [Acuticoccus kalidii]MCF3933691.1 exopolysaccharide biosynthesis protein [Acuticoccus kalidii]